MTRARGMALVIGLLLMAALSLLALIATSGMVLQRQMAGNFRDDALALREAGFAESEAEAWLNSRADIERESSCATGCLLPPGIVPAESLPEQPEFASAAWWQAHGFPVGFNPASGEQRECSTEGAEPPRWVVAEAHFEPSGDTPGELTVAGLAYYRIFSRGLGRQPGSIAVLETVVARPWEGEYEVGEYPTSINASSFCRQFAGRYPCGRLAWRRRR